MTRKQLIEEIGRKQSFLCVGLDTDPGKIPQHLLSAPDPVFEFNKEIIDATKPYCVSYKINTAFYEAMGIKGWELLEKTVDYIPEGYLKIADAKRGDIGNTSAQYAKTFFEVYNFDAVTVAPYMGEDSIRPFLDYSDKWTIVLGLTSNKGANDFEMLSTGSSFLFEKVLTTVSSWGTTENLMFVTGATQASQFEQIRKLVPDHFLLVPGVGTQGGSLDEVSRYGLIPDVGLLVNASRAILYAGNNHDFAGKAATVAEDYSREMAGYLSRV
ncbi:orotidine-5'-phosphate decarboxylase [Segetibacter sp. 3557_3]|uniref:orotidine-5'-phosphate decarboxylase n=1 Tax=Segetibacter sp. 3557_3 TaxID=2547429 RepID=UPI0010591E4D|nr:orotidine-5'-phosphate decarboxylase [Segetibacter sp. 3557_3]TDH25583.1 orotidine-5'-phosphate decarboxylase [Segetibacter sp. 3557_3]